MTVRRASPRTPTPCRGQGTGETCRLGRQSAHRTNRRPCVRTRSRLHLLLSTGKTLLHPAFDQDLVVSYEDWILNWASRRLCDGAGPRCGVDDLVWTIAGTCSSGVAILDGTAGDRLVHGPIGAGNEANVWPDRGAPGNHQRQEQHASHPSMMSLGNRTCQGTALTSWADGWQTGRVCHA